METLRGKVAPSPVAEAVWERQPVAYLPRPGQRSLPLMSVANAESICSTIRTEGGRALPCQLDVTAEVQVKEALDRIVAEHDRLDVLINNAGVDVTAPIEDLSVTDWDRIIGVNLRGPFLMSRHALGLMRRQGAGHIVNIVSTAARRAWANASAYHASKWGLLGFSQRSMSRLDPTVSR